jgi:hypothetical protein
LTFKSYRSTEVFQKNFNTILWEPGNSWCHLLMKAAFNIFAFVLDGGSYAHIKLSLLNCSLIL